MHNLTREQIIGVSAAFIIGVGFFVLTNTFSSPFDIENAERSFSQRVAGSESLKTSSLRVEDVFVGDGIVASAGDTVTVHYAGILTDGTSFDNSLERNQPIRFILGAGQVMDGWDQGLLGMKEGGRRVLLIPPHLGYGSQGAGIIPPNATLVFEVVLLSVEKAEE